MKTSVIEVRDMLSALSVDEVEERIGAVPGVESATVNYAAHNATVRYDETLLDVDDIKAAVHQRRHQSEGESAPKHGNEHKPARKGDVAPTSEAAPGAQPSAPEAAEPRATQDVPAPAQPSKPEVADPKAAPDAAAAPETPVADEPIGAPDTPAAAPATPLAAEPNADPAEPPAVAAPAPAASDHEGHSVRAGRARHDAGGHGL